MITRKAAAALLHSSVQIVRNAERRGELRPVKLEGVHFFSSRDVLAYAARREGRLGRLTAQACTLFRQGHGIVDVAIALEAELDHVTMLFGAWNRAEGMLIVELPKPLAHWARVYHASLGDFTPRRLLRALEICLSSAELRQQLDTLSA